MASQALLKTITSARFTQSRLLLKMGADVNYQDAKGQTPLMHALALDDPKVRFSFLRILLNAGALVSVSDDRRNNAVMWAIRDATPRDVLLLLRHADIDLNVNAQNNDGQTALWLAVDGGMVEVVTKLLDVLAKDDLTFEVADTMGVTPAMRAAMLGHMECLRLVIERAAKCKTTFINMSQINIILKSLPHKENPPRERKDTQQNLDYPRSPSNGFQHLKPLWTPRKSKTMCSYSESSAKTSKELPAIVVLSPGSQDAAKRNTRTRWLQTQPRDSDGYPQFSTEFLQDSNRCSTPLTTTRPSSTPRPSEPVFLASRYDHASPRIWNNTPRHRPQRETTEEAARRVTGGGFHSGRKSKTVIPALSTSPDPEDAGMESIPPPVRRTKTFTTTFCVRDVLPRLLEMSAMQHSGSFRKSAKPAPSLKRRSTFWLKLKGVAVMSQGLKKAAARRKSSHGRAIANLTAAVTETVKRKRSSTLKPPTLEKPAA